MFWKPMAIMLPHSGVGASTPAPMKLRAAVSRIDQPTLTESWASTGAMALGMTWRSRIAQIRGAGDIGGLDIAQLRIDSTWLRISRR